MQNVSQEIKNAYKDTTRDKLLFFKYGETVLTGFNVVSNTFSITDTLCSSENLEFGTVESKEMKVSFNGTSEEIKAIANQKIDVIQKIEISKEPNNDPQGIPERAISYVRNGLYRFYYLMQGSTKVLMRDYYSNFTLREEKEYVLQERIDNIICSYYEGMFLTHKNKNYVTKVVYNGSTTQIQLKEHEKEFVNLLQDNIYYKKNTDEYSQFYRFEQTNYKSVKLGSYYCNQPKIINNRTVEVTALDVISKFDIDVSNWWATLTYPTTIKDMLLSLCTKCGVVYDGATFVNETMPINQANNTMSNLKGRDVLKWIGQASGTFPKATIDDKLTLFKIVKPLESDTNLVTVDTFKSNSLSIANYDVQKIDKLQIKVTSNDIGVVVGTGENTLIISDNPLLYSMNDTSLRPYAENILNAVQDLSYTPYQVSMPYLPYLESGEFFKLQTSDKTILAMISIRNITGTKTLFENVSAKGNKTRDVVTVTNNSTERLYGRVNELERTVEQTKSTLTDNMNGLQTQMTQTSSEINLQAQQFKYKNLLVNSDFTSWESGVELPTYWKDYNTGKNTYEIVNDNDFPTGKALKITGTSGTLEYVFQEAQCNVKTRYLYMSFDHKRISHGTGGNAINGLIYYKPKSSNAWTYKLATMSYAITTLNKYGRYQFTFDLGEDIELIGVAPIIYGSRVGTIEMINRVFLTTDQPKPDKNLWNNYASNDVISQINLSPTGVKIKGEKIDVTGFVTFSALSGSGTTTINADNITTGTINALTINAPVLNNISSINGVAVNATGTISVQNWNGRIVVLRYQSGLVTGWNETVNTRRGIVDSSTLYVKNGYIYCGSYQGGDGNLVIEEKKVIVYGGVMFAEGIVSFD